MAVNISSTIDLASSSNTPASNLNFLQPSNFKVVIDRKKYGNLEFFVQRVVHPGLTISNPTIPYSRIGSISVPGDTAQFEDLSMDVIMDEQMKGYTEVYDWMLRSVQTNHTARDARKAEEPIEVDILLAITSSNNNLIKQIRYRDCVPTSLGTMLMESVTNTTTVVTFPLTFKVGYFEVL